MKAVIVTVLHGLAFIVACQAAPAAAGTQTAAIYRCGPEGRDLRDSPCPAGSPASTAAIPYEKPSPEQARAARERARQDEQLASAMRKERLAREEREYRLHARAGSLSAAHAAKPSASATTRPAHDSHAKGPQDRRHSKRHARPETKAEDTRPAADAASNMRHAKAPAAATAQTGR